MSREELIRHWEAIVNAVFWADSRLMPEWSEKLSSATKDTAPTIAREYVNAVATEIVDYGGEDESHN